jgi:hypothetical protein
MVLALLLLPAVSVGSQIPGLSSGKKPPAQTAPADSLGRDNPHDTVMGLFAAQDENYSVAAQYFQPPPGIALGRTEEQDLAVQLLAVMNQKICRTRSIRSAVIHKENLTTGFPPITNCLAAFVNHLGQSPSNYCVWMTITITRSG